MRLGDTEQVELTSSKSSIMRWRSERLDSFQWYTVSVTTQHSYFSLREHLLTGALRGYAPAWISSVKLSLC